MTILRFIFPFLFTRNWHDGAWELSRPRLVLFLVFIALLALGGVIVYVLQTPVVYTLYPA